MSDQDTWEIRSRFMVENPENLRMTLKTTARMREWAELNDQLANLGDKPLAYELKRQISSMLAQARKTHFPEDP
jgi:hypothetical protein